MKKIRKNIKMIIGIVIGVIISVTTSYVLAATLINSKDVVYQDNMSIGATNVQNAIDGTCSKIDTRLSAIEDKLYTIESLGDYVFSFYGKSTISYTGFSLTFPANSYCTFSVNLRSPNSLAMELRICGSDKNCDSPSFMSAQQSESLISELAINRSFYTESSFTYYVWARYRGENNETLKYTGFCATKVK